MGVGTIFLMAFALMLILEGVLPFLAPSLWRETFRRITQMSDGQIMKWLLPEYVEDILPAEARRIESSRRKILYLCFSRNYELVMPPLLEFTDSLFTGTGGDRGLRT